MGNIFLLCDLKEVQLSGSVAQEVVSSAGACNGDGLVLILKLQLAI